MKRARTCYWKFQLRLNPSIKEKFKSSLLPLQNYSPSKSSLIKIPWHKLQSIIIKKGTNLILCKIYLVKFSFQARFIRKEEGLYIFIAMKLLIYRTQNFITLNWPMEIHMYLRNIWKTTAIIKLHALSLVMRIGPIAQLKMVVTLVNTHLFSMKTYHRSFLAI